MPGRSPADRTPRGAEWRDSQGKRLVDYPRPSVAVDVAVLTVAPVSAVVGGLDPREAQQFFSERAWGADSSESSKPRGRGSSASRSGSGGSDPERGVLAVVVHRREWVMAGGPPGRWALPGTFVHERERLADAVLRALRAKCGIEGLQPHQLRVFDDPGRDPRGWVMSVAHTDVLPYARVVPVLEARPDVRLVPVPSGGEAAESPAWSGRSHARGEEPWPESRSDAAARANRGARLETSVFRDLVLDHRAIIHAAVAELRARYADRPDPASLLGDEPFTLLQLRLLHEAVLGVELQKDTFRRHMDGQLRPSRSRSQGTVGRPAQLYRRGLGAPTSRSSGTLPSLHEAEQRRHQLRSQRDAPGSC